MTIARGLCSLAMAGALAACGQSSQAVSLTADGSTALQPLVEQAASDYTAKHPGMTITVSGGGSAKGLKDVASGAVDIGDSDVDAAAAGLDDHQVAVLAFAIVNGSNVGITSLTREQVAGIFNGKITNWKQVGGKDQPIVVISRPIGSGTRRVFTQYFLNGTEAKSSASVEDSSEKVAIKVKSTPGAVSYVGLSYAQKFNAPIMQIDGVEPSIANVRNHTYGFWSYEHMYTAAKPAPGTEDFIDFVRSDDAVLDRLGFFAIKDVAQSPSTSESPQ